MQTFRNDTEENLVYTVFSLYVFLTMLYVKKAGIAQLVKAGRSGGRTLANRRYSVPFQTGLKAYPASCTMDTRPFAGVERPGPGADHPNPF